MNTINEIIKTLQLEKHCEGGYYRRTYCSTIDCQSQQGNPRQSLSSIYYLTTQESGFSALCINRSDLILYHHQGDPLKVVLFDPATQKLEEHLLGQDLQKGQRPQLISPGNVWKAYDLMGGSHALISEAVTPSFEYEDMRLLSTNDLNQCNATVIDKLAPYLACDTED